MQKQTTAVTGTCRPGPAGSKENNVHEFRHRTSQISYHITRSLSKSKLTKRRIPRVLSKEIICLQPCSLFRLLCSDPALHYHYLPPTLLTVLIWLFLLVLLAPLPTLFILLSMSPFNNLSSSMLKLCAAFDSSTKRPLMSG